MKGRILLIIAMFLVLISSVSALDIASDNFESDSYSGGLGWNDVWLTSGGCEISSTGSPIDSYYLRARSSCIATRNFDNSMYGNNIVSFYAGSSSLENADHCYYSYYDGTSYTQLLDLGNGDDDGVMRYYSYPVSTTSSNAGIRIQTSSSQSGDYCYIDNVVMTGDALATEINVYSNLEYQKGSTITLDMTSSLLSSPHTFEVYDSNDVLVCDETIVSPSVSNTIFQGSCLIPDVVQNNAYIYLEAVDGTNVTKTFNIVGSSIDNNKVHLDRVYFSPQVLQGGSTEIYAIVDGDEPLDSVSIDIKFPDNSTRFLNMVETLNPGEYRAFITDTYQTGNTTFTIRAEGGVYFDEYVNVYFVAPYNVDFVDTVNNVNEILSQPPNIDVLGTYYEVGDIAKTIAQLSSQGLPINDASCFISIYHPDNSVHIRNTAMTYVENSDGLYTYDLVAPNWVGVYPMSVVCDYETAGDIYYVLNATYNYGSSSSVGTELWFDDENFSELTTEPVGNVNIADVELQFFGVNSTIADSTQMYVEWNGYTEIANATASLYWWDFTEGEWEVSENVLSSDFTEVTFNRPDDGHEIFDYINNGEVRVKLNGSVDSELTSVEIISDDFEDGVNFPAYFVEYDAGSTTGVRNGALNGQSAYIQGDDESDTQAVSELIFNFSTIGYENINVQYNRQAVGFESTDLFEVSVTNGTSIADSNIFEGWETGNFNSQNPRWTDTSWYNQGSNIITGNDNPNTGNYHLNIRGTGITERGLDMSGASEVTISFVEDHDSFESGEEAYFQVETNANSNVFVTLHTWVDGVSEGNGDNTLSFDLTDYPSIVFSNDNRIRFQTAMSGNGDDVWIDNLEIDITGASGTVLESWSANQAQQTVNFNLDSSYENLANAQLIFRADVNYDNEFFDIDDVIITGDQQLDSSIFTDFIHLHLINAVGVVNEVRGGGELNVKDRLDAIEQSIANIGTPNSTVGEIHEIFFAMPQVYSPNDIPMISIRLYERDHPSQGEDNAICTYSIFGKDPFNESTNTLYTYLSEAPMTNGQGGRYFAFPSGNWLSGIYQIEVNCNDGDAQHYGIDGFRMEANYESYLQTIQSNTENISQVQLETITTDLENISTQLNSLAVDIPIVMIGGTEYNPDDDGLIGIRLARSNGVLETGATCDSSILYPNGTLYIDADSMTEYGEGIYYYNFTVPSPEGVYQYFTDCNKGSKDYYGYNTFHVSPLYNWTTDLSGIISYLDNMNTTLTTIDGRTINIENIVTDSNNRMVLLNGTIVDMYDLLLEMNQTITTINNFAASIDANVLDIQSTVNGIESVVLDINGTVVQIDANIIAMNGTVANIYSDTQQIRQDLIYMNNTINTIENTTLDIQGQVVTINGKVDQIYNAVVQINGTVNDIENVALTIDGKVDIIDTVVDGIALDVNFIENAVITINSTTNTIDGKVDIIDANVDELQNAIITINGTVNGIENTVLTIAGDVTNIEGIVSSINTTVNDIYGLNVIMNTTLNTIDDSIAVIDGKVDFINATTSNIENVVLDIQGTVNGIEGTTTTISGNVIGISNDLISINGTLSQGQTDLTQGQVDIVNNILNLNTSLSQQHQDILAAIGGINSTDVITLLNSINTNLSQGQVDILDAVVSVNDSVILVQGTVNGIENTVITINGTVNTIETKVDIIDGKIDQLSNDIFQLNNTANTISNSLIDMNGTIVSIEGTVNGIENTVIDINGTVNTINSNLLNLEIQMNASNQEILDAVNGSNQVLYDYLVSLNSSMDTSFSTVLNEIALINTSNADVLDAIALLNTSNDDVLSFLTNMELNIGNNFTQIYDEFSQINTSNQDVLDAISLLNTSNDDVMNYLTTIEGSLDSNFTQIFNEFSLINTSNQDVLDAVALINTSNQDVLTELSSIETNVLLELQDVDDAIAAINTSNQDVIDYLYDLDGAISGNFTQVLFDISQINTSNQDVLDAVALINTSNQDVLTEIALINTSNQDVIDYLTLFESSVGNNFSQVLFDISQINNTDVIDYLSLINTSIDGDLNTIIYDISQINTSNQDVLDAVALINTSNADVLSQLTITNALINSTSQNVINELGNVENNLLAYLIDINDTQCDCDTIIDYLQNIENDTTNIVDLLGVLNGSQNTQLSQIYDLLTIVNSTQYDYSQELADLYSVSLEINETQFNYTQELDDIYSLLLNMNGTLYYLEGEVDGITLSLIDMNATLIDVQTTVNEIETTLVDVNGTVYSIQNDVDGIEISLVDMNSTIVDVENKVDNLESMLINMNGTLVYVESVVDGLEVSLIDMNGTIVDTQNTVNQIDTNLIGVNNSVFLMQQDIDGIELNLLDMNGTIVDTNNVVHTIDGTLVNMNNTLYLVQQTTEGIEVSLVDMNNTIISTQDTVNNINSNVISINNTVSTIENAVITIDGKVDDLQNGIITINGTVNGIENTVLTINGTLNSVDSKIDVIDTNVDTLLTNFAQMNATINNIENGVMNLSLDHQAILDALSQMNGTINNIEGLALNINNSIDYFDNFLQNMNGTLYDVYGQNVDLNNTLQEIYGQNADLNSTLWQVYGQNVGLNQTIYDLYGDLDSTLGDIYGQNTDMNSTLWDLYYLNENMNTTLNDVHTLVFEINETTYEIQNLTITIDEKIDYLTDLTLIINGTVYSYIDEFILIQELIANQTEMLNIALADVSYFNGTNSSDYYENLSVLTPSILETQMYKVAIDTIQDPIEGNLYELNYYVFNRDTGDLIQETKKTITGVDSFELALSSDLLGPEGKTEQLYDIWVRVEMLNGMGFYQSFPLDYVGELNVVHLNDNGPRGPGLYDVIVGTSYERWDVAETVTAEFLIKNTGDEPDEDTVLTYWLEDASGNVYGETKEQFLEVPPGNTIITRDLALPLLSSPGEWKFKAEYETVVQPKIAVYDGFQVAEMTTWEKLQDRLPIFIQNNWLIFWGFIFILLILLLILLVMSIGSKKRNYKKEVYTNKHKKVTKSNDFDYEKPKDFKYER